CETGRSSARPTCLRSAQHAGDWRRRETTESPGSATETAPSSPASREESIPLPAAESPPSAAAFATRRRDAGSAWAASASTESASAFVVLSVTLDTGSVKSYTRSILPRPRRRRMATQDVPSRVPIRDLVRYYLRL